MPSVPASVGLTAFSCLHCDVFTSQKWHKTMARAIGDGATPRLSSKELLDELVRAKFDNIGEKNRYLDYVKAGLDKKLYAKPLCLESFNLHITNLYASECFNCGELTLWLHDRPIYPDRVAGAIPNPDIDSDIRDDIEEARAIVSRSPRGAAALLRLALQKLCVQLGEPSKNIDADIASLVSKGLSPMLQQSLDVIRVVGNEAVHPGTLDVRDDATLALTLFDVINVIAEQMISIPARIGNLYTSLPEQKLAGIATRDAKAKAKLNAS